MNDTLTSNSAVYLTCRIFLTDELGGERDKFRLVLGEMDSTFAELAGF